MKLSKLVPALAIAVIAAASGAWFASQVGNAGIDYADSDARIQEKLQNTLILPEDFKAVPPFKLSDKNGETVSDDLFRQQWTLAFFGFTHCPDVCPMTLSVVSDAVNDIAEAGKVTPPGVIFISVDPKRDKAELLKRYVEYFNPDFNALTGELTDTLALTKSLNIVVAYTADKDNPENYTVDHTAAILLIDPQGRIRGKFNAPHDAETLSQDYQTIMQYLQPQTS